MSLSLKTVNSGIYGLRDYSYLHIKRQRCAAFKGHPQGRLSGLQIQVHISCNHMCPRKIPTLWHRHKSVSLEARCLAIQHAVSAFCKGVGQKNWAKGSEVPISRQMQEGQLHVHRVGYRVSSHHISNGSARSHQMSLSSPAEL